MNSPEKTPERQSQCSSQLSTQEQLITELAKALENLRERLDPVLLREPSDTEEEGKDQDVLVPLADRIRNNSERIAKAIRYAEDIKRNLEV